MEHDLEVGGAIGASGVVTPVSHPVASGIPCANCGAVVEDRYCTACGQLASDFHRPVWELVGHTLSDSFSLDGRLWRTLPTLLLRPGRMTRNYLDGQRARYVPPFRLFLLSSLLFFLLIFTASDRLGWFDNWQVTPNSAGGFSFADLSIGGVDDGDIAALKEASEDLDTPVAARQATEAAYEAALSERAIISAFASAVDGEGRIDRVQLFDQLVANMEQAPTEEQAVELRSAIDRAVTTYENRGLIGARMRAWAPRFSVLFLPIFASFLILIYVWRRKNFVYDHIVTALHFQTWLYVLGTVLIGGGILVPSLAPWLITVGVLAPIVYLYRMLRVTYHSGHVQSALRASFLFVISLVTLFVLAVALVAASVSLT